MAWATKLVNEGVQAFDGSEHTKGEETPPEARLHQKYPWSTKKVG